MRILRRNNGGFTLVEVMIAMMITLVTMLGLLVTVDIATEQNVKTAMRDEAMQIAEDRMSNFRARAFDQISSAVYPAQYSWTPLIVQSRMRGGSTNHTVFRTVSALTDNSKLITVRVRWRFKNNSTAQALQTVVSRPPS